MVERLNIFSPNFVKRILFALCFSIPFVSNAQVNLNLGQFRIENFSPKDYKSHPQNWAIAQDQNGLMYFGNNLGILVYDGVGWQLVKTKNESTVRSLDVSPDGKVFAGASGDFGYLDADENGRYDFVSLRKLYNLSEDAVGNVYSVETFAHGVYFMTEEMIYYYNGKILRLWENEMSYQSAFRINSDYVVNKAGLGMHKMLEDSLIRIAGINDFSDKKVIDYLLLTPEDPLVLTMKQGIHRYGRKKSYSSLGDSFIEKVNQTIIPLNPDNIEKIHGDVMSVGTWGNGLILIDREGDVIQSLNNLNGLVDDVITEQFIDKSGNLWLTTSNGISKVTLEDDLAVYKERANVNETVEKIVRFNDRIFLATHTGLFSWEEENKTGSFQKVTQINTECWDIKPVEIEGRSLLLIAGNNAIYQMDEYGGIEKIVSCLPWTFHQLESDPTTILVGLDDGLMCLKYDGGTWVIQNNVAGISNTIYSIAQSESRKVWLGTLHDGVFRLDIRERITHYPYQFDARHFGQKEGLPEGGIYVADYVGGMIYGTSNGLYGYHRDKNVFTEEKIYKEVIGIDQFTAHRVSEDPLGRLWLSAYVGDEFILGYVKRNGSTPLWKDEVFRPISREVFHSIYHDEDGSTWLGGPDGLFRFGAGEEENHEYSEFATMIRKLTLNNDSVNYSGNLNALNYGEVDSSIAYLPMYPYEYNSVSFTFSSQFHKYPELNEYSYQLLGFDKEWTEWAKDEKAVYTNLHEGEYTFKVRSRNIYGYESEVSQFTFKIKAPWYRAWWAYIIYGVLSVIFVYVVVVFYTRQLKSIIKERTAEVVEQKEKIEKQKDEVEHQRKLLEIKNADITSSINYAKRLQEALLPNDDFLNKHLKEHFILYKPKDIVSGDFYWMEHLNGIPGRDITLFATVDCTGHGVPGAFVSVVGNGGLNRAVNEFGLTRPNEILEKLNEIVVDTLSKGEDELRDGMDISLCMFDMHNMEMQFAGANNSVYIFRKGIEDEVTSLNGNGKFYRGDLCEIKANKQPIGYYEYHKTFSNNSIKIRKGDVIYLFSDGFTDQFGGPNCKKYNVTRFRNFLLNIFDKPMSAQRELVEKEFESWKGSEDQIDDVIVAGIRI